VQAYAAETSEGKGKFLEAYDKNGRNKNLSWVTTWTDTSTRVSKDMLEQNANFLNRNLIST
jgi:hypothetical protein